MAPDPDAPVRAPPMPARTVVPHRVVRGWFAGLDARCHPRDRRWSAGEWDHVMAADGWTVLVASPTPGEPPVGVLVAADDGGALAVAKLMVDPRCRRMGLARGLLRGLGDAPLTLTLPETDREGLAAAVALGFRPTGLLRRRGAGSVDDVRLRRDPPPKGG